MPRRSPRRQAKKPHQPPDPAELAAEYLDRARRADLLRTDTFASVAMRAANEHGCKGIADVACGSSPHLGLRLLALGYGGELSFIDWFMDPLLVHHTSFHAAVEELGLGPETPAPRHWCPVPIQLVSFERSWLAIHRTLPREIADDATAHKPRGADDGAVMLRSLAESGAAGLTAMVGGVEHETLCAGAAALGWAVTIEEGVLDADFEPEGPHACVHLTFPAAH